MSHIPVRTGLKSIKFALHKVCKWSAKFRDVWTDFMTTEQLAVMDNLVTVCNDVVALIDAVLAT